MSRRISISLIFIVGIIGAGCDGLIKPKRIVSEDDVLLAQVDEHEMYLSDIDGMITTQSPADSINQLNSYVQQWLKRNVVLNEAEDKFPSNVDIDKLVEDYRSSLLLHNYRQMLIEETLDTTITPQQEVDFYDQNKDQFSLQDPICKGRIATIPDDTRGLEKFYRNWKKGDQASYITYLNENASFQFDTEEHWYSVSEFMSMLPKQQFKEKDIQAGKNLQKHHDASEYFVTIGEVLDAGQAAPISYIRENIRKLIINKRKKAILDNIEHSLYQNYLQTNRIKVLYDK